MINFERFTHLSFDCYGTLIDWEAGILGALRPILERHGVKLVDEQILALYSRYEEEGEGGDYKPYRDILRSIMNRIAPGLGIVPTEAEVDALAKSVGSWPVFPDTV
ncbi:MAG: haloacid dehalogenase, partial [Acidobacteriota bacterium]